MKSSCVADVVQRLEQLGQVLGLADPDEALDARP